MTTENMIPSAEGLPEDPYIEDADYDTSNDEIDPNEKGIDVHPEPQDGDVQQTTDTNISGSVETSVPDKDVRTEDQK